MRPLNRCLFPFTMHVSAELCIRTQLCAFRRFSQALAGRLPCGASRSSNPSFQAIAACCRLPPLSFLPNPEARIAHGLPERDTGIDLGRFQIVVPADTAELALGHAWIESPGHSRGRG